jgi:Fe-S-cluster-containing hydrogenase component 2
MIILRETMTMEEKAEEKKPTGEATKTSSEPQVEKTGWGVENMPNPTGVGLIQARWDLCTGCGMCEMACSMKHFGVIHRELSRIRIYRYFLPVAKSVQNVCCQCSEKERECQKACPVDPPVIHYDKEKFHMVVDKDRCLGSACGQCREACPAKVPLFCPPEADYCLVCDLCVTDGVRKPQCVEVCPNHALEYMAPQFPQHLERFHPDQKAEYLSQRLYPLPKDRIQIPPEELFKEEK